jgi:hypothetical protein
MNYWLYYIGVPSIIFSIERIIMTIIKEKEKRKRITLFKKIDNSKIEAIGNYEKKTKRKYFLNRKSKAK